MRLLTCILCACVVAMAAAAGADGGGGINSSHLPLPLRYASRMIREHSSLPPFFRTSASSSPPSFEQPDTTCAEGEAGATDPLMGTRGGSTRVKGGRAGGATAAQKKAAAEYKARQQQAGKNANKAKRKKVSPAAPPAKKTKPAASAAAKAKAKATTKKGAAAVAPASTAAASTTSANPGSGLLTTGSTQMPTLFFTPTEADLDRYAACLAAAEGLRRARDAGVASSRVRRALQDIDSGKLDASTSKNKAKDRMMKRWSADERREFDTLRASYALNTAKMVRSLGLSVARFNQLGKVVGSDPVLKERVMEQAYLYGMAAGLTGMEKVPLITGKRIGSGGGSRGKKGGKSAGSDGGGAAGALPPITSEQIDAFARCLSEVEELREGNLEKLRQSLKVDYLPPVICDPNVRSLLDPRVRAVCDAFPLQAEEVVQRFGMGSDEFNALLDRLRCDPIFRFRVKRSMRKL